MSMRLLIAGFIGCLAVSAQAVGINTGTGGLDDNEMVETVTASGVEDLTRVNTRTLNYGPTLKQAPAALDSTSISPFGEQLFQGGFRGVRADGINPDYRLMPGDLITLRLWGAVELERVLPVDAQGFVFIPSVGPLKVQGISHQALNARVKSAVKSVYPDNVNVYTNLQGTQPVAIFVTGEVVNPGRYAGTANDSVLFFLDQAGGVDKDLGSYRDIAILRNGKEIASADLYQFLSAGILPNLQLKDGDTLLVKRRLAHVALKGDVERSYLYELTSTERTGAALLKYARLKPGVSHVLVRGIREKSPFSRYYTLAEFKTLTLANGDELLFNADIKNDTIVVQVEGSFSGPSRYAVPKGTRLHTLLDNIEVPAQVTDVSNISLRRLSVAVRQKESLKESLRRLETTYLGAPSATPQEAEIRIREAALIADFIKRAGQVEPNGRMVVTTQGEVADIRMQDGDIITIPEASDALLISGEVLVPQAAVYVAGQSVEAYLDSAGGLTQHADKDNILVVRLNGEVRKATEVEPMPGDEIIVLPAVPTKNLQLATSITQILYQLAVAAKVAIDL